MLRLKQALMDCGISQQALVKASGYSKALISRTLTFGVLPQDADKFKAGVARLVGDDARLIDWLNDRHMHTEDLYAKVYNPSPFALALNPAFNELECALYELAGRAVLSADGLSGLVIRLVQATIHLRRKMAETVGHDSPFVERTETELMAILERVNSEQR